MKRSIFYAMALFVLAALVVPFAFAAITLTITLNDNYQAKLEGDRETVNRDLCRKLWKQVVNAGGTPAWGPPTTTKGNCSRAQACTVAGAVGGASCTVAQAADIGYFDGTQNGRERHAETLLKDFLDQRAAVRQAANDVEDWCDWFKGLTPPPATGNGTRIDECTRWKLPPTCDPWKCLPLQ